MAYLEWVVSVNLVLGSNALSSSLSHPNFPRGSKNYFALSSRLFLLHLVWRVYIYDGLVLVKRAQDGSSRENKNMKRWFSHTPRYASLHAHELEVWEKKIVITVRIGAVVSHGCLDVTASHTFEYLLMNASRCLNTHIVVFRYFILLWMGRFLSL